MSAEAVLEVLLSQIVVVVVVVVVAVCAARWSHYCSENLGLLVEDDEEEVEVVGCYGVHGEVRVFC